MRKDQKEALQRLEQALLEDDEQEASAAWEDAEDSDAWLEEYFEETAEEDGLDYDVYNTDPADVDMESYSESVREAPQKPGCALPVFLVLIAVLGCLTVWFLKKWGLV